MDAWRIVVYCSFIVFAHSFSNAEYYFIVFAKKLKMKFIQGWALTCYFGDTSGWIRKQVNVQSVEQRSKDVDQLKCLRGLNIRGEKTHIYAKLYRVPT